MAPNPQIPVTIALPYRFDTSNVWHTILKGALGLNALLILCVLIVAFSRPWPMTVGLAICELMVFAFTLLLVRFQEGSIGVIHDGRVDLESNAVLGVRLPGPAGSYPLDRFLGVRVEYRMGPVDPGVQGGPNEVIWLVGKIGTPSLAIARSENGAGRYVGQAFAKLLSLPLEETGAPGEIRL